MDSIPDPSPQESLHTMAVKLCTVDRQGNENGFVPGTSYPRASSHWSREGPHLSIRQVLHARGFHRGSLFLLTWAHTIPERRNRG